jgi:AcrR family transcriptional regulator
MVRMKDPAVRKQLLERAAHLLRTREPLTLRSLVAGTGVSTMAVYTYFGDLEGVWKALRQEGFTRLAARFAEVAASGDPVEDLTTLVAVYLGNALDHPDLYRVMFDANFALEDLKAADATLEHLVQAAARARAAGRFRAGTVPLELATQSWTIAHGLASLVSNGPLPRETLDNGVPLLTALFIHRGDDPRKCRRSVKNGWKNLSPPNGS